LYLLARGDNAKIMKEKGLTLYHGENNNPHPIPINIIEDLNETNPPDIIFIAVKNYDLEEVSKDIHEKLGDKPIIVGLQNGIENQEVFPKYFTKIVYSVINFAAWKDGPGVFGYRDKGQLVIGTPNNENSDIVALIRSILKLISSTKVSKKFLDAVHTKLIINLMNSAITLISYDIDDNTSLIRFKEIYFSVLNEGIDVVEAAGYKEHRIRGPSWKGMQLGKQLFDDQSMVNFKDQLKYGINNSMVQDIILIQRDKSEIESLTGYLIKLANKLKMEVPNNQIIYEMCKKQFSKKPFERIDVNIIWEKIHGKIDGD
jgi:2-dehydropantoate 2-reductase